ncbi:5-(carboxyamino)imidazole ribonucleotide synthase [Sphingomonas gilva]|uniref:N5-carboxyaminoimidazole ribonucleotide synthase n=1 Tax=Sphingomonas gilva TaxID=2305907 RepID=A0A396RTR3_9SPHN|nr:5-(carboxyamino)imidazole ribonucleotide synthase [Sphingomonas gilva]RHW18802.1 5-(carboxyamino)imidazole ribonucleotide synthase [Sphingomonas gilva]
MSALPPNSTIGVIGSGQLGRMLAIAAAQLGYRCHVYAPETGPANDVAPLFTEGAYDDEAALSAFAAQVDVVTYEFENIDAEAIGALPRVHPHPRAVAVAQDRLVEKDFVTKLGGRTAPYAPVPDRAALDQALSRIGAPAILKTTRFGYDGKGQARLSSPADADIAWAAIGARPAVLEGLVAFDHEYSVLLARAADGAVALYDPPENVHRNGILDRSTLPAPAIVAAQFAEASALARAIADALDYVGLLACEFFASADGPVFNEMAPRVHNSGHWTIEGADASQFENHVRAICGLPLGSTALTAPRVEMANLIGDEAADWPRLLAEPGLHLHLYGKHEPRPGRKMGHWTRLAE